MPHLALHFSFGKSEDGWMVFGTSRQMCRQTVTKEEKEGGWNTVGLSGRLTRQVGDTNPRLPQPPHVEFGRDFIEVNTDKLEEIQDCEMESGDDGVVMDGVLVDT